MRIGEIPVVIALAPLRPIPYNSEAPKTLNFH
jgi:hypothetical protein